MGKIVVNDINGNPKYTLDSKSSDVFILGATHDVTLMSADTITIDVVSENRQDFSIGDNIQLRGNLYRINQSPRICKESDGSFTATLVFESAKYELANVVFLLPNEVKNDTLTASLSDILGIIVQNANRVHPTEWAVGRIPNNNETITEQFTEKNCLSALQRLCELFRYEFRIKESSGVKTIDIIEQGEKLRLFVEYGRGKGHGLYTITREATSSEDVITRLFAYGSADNLPNGYPHTRLCLPAIANSVCRRNESYIGDVSKINQFGVKESVVNFEDVKPHCRSKVTSVVRGDVNSFIDTSIFFNLLAFWQSEDFLEFCQIRGYDKNDTGVQEIFTNDIVGKERKYIVDGSATIQFTSGNLAGYSFKVNNFDFSSKKFTLTPLVLNDGDEVLQQTLPDSNAFKITEGDTYVISDINLPSQFVTNAEVELKNKAIAYYMDHSKVNARYGIEFDQVQMMRLYPNGVDISVGDYIHVKDTELGIDDYIKVIRTSKDLLTDSLSVQISDIKPKNPNSISLDMVGKDDVAIENQEFVQTSLSSAFTANYSDDLHQYHSNYITSEEGVFIDASLTGKKRQWIVPRRVKEDLNSAYGYNIFVKASKKTNFADIYYEPDVANILSEALGGEVQKPNAVISRKPKVISNRDSNYYYFRIGTLSKAKRRVSDMVLMRHLVLDYGFARMSANDIAGGDIIIQDTSGNIVIDTKKKAGNFQTLTADFQGIPINIPDKIVANGKDVRVLANNDALTIEKVNEIAEKLNGKKVQDCDMSTGQCKEYTFEIKPIMPNDIQDISEW